jgi:hypothetical protein
MCGSGSAPGRRQGRSKRDARANARLGLAVVRGLLLDRLATGDRKGCDDAMERFIAGFVPAHSGRAAQRS